MAPESNNPFGSVNYTSAATPFVAITFYVNSPVLCSRSPGSTCCHYSGDSGCRNSRFCTLPRFLLHAESLEDRITALHSRRQDIIPAHPLINNFTTETSQLKGIARAVQHFSPPTHRHSIHNPTSNHPLALATQTPIIPPPPPPPPKLNTTHHPPKHLLCHILHHLPSARILNRIQRQRRPGRV
jgi:hypothetical protein